MRQNVVDVFMTLVEGDRKKFMKTTNENLGRQFSRQAATVTGAKVVYLLTRFALPPLILSYVTLEEYGLWSATFVLLGYLGMGAVGVSNVYVRYVAEYHTHGEQEKINHLLTTGLVLMITLGAVMLSLIWWTLPGIVGSFGVPPHLQKAAFSLMFGAAAVFMLDLSVGAFAYVLMGLRRVTEQTRVWMASFLLETALIVILLYRGHGIYALLWAFVARYLFAVIGQTVASYRALPGLSLRPRYFDRRALRLFFGYGAIVQASSLLGMFLYSVEKLLASFLLGVRAVGLLDIGEKLPVMASQLPATINGLFLPTLAHLQIQERYEEMRNLYLRGLRYLNLLNGLLLGFLAAFAGPLITAWTGADERLAAAATIMTIMCLPYQLHELTGPASAMHRAQGKPSRELIYPLMQLSFVAITVATGLLAFGKTLMVICGAVALSMVGSALLYLLYTNRLLGVEQPRFWRSVLLPGLLPYLVGFSLLLPLRSAFVLSSRLMTLGWLALAGIIYVLLMLAIGYRWLIDDSERVILLEKTSIYLRRRRLWSAPA